MVITSGMLNALGMGSDDDNRPPILAALAILGTIALLIAGDLWVERHGGGGFWHLATELLVFTCAAVGALVLWIGLRSTQHQLMASRQEATEWRNESEALLRGLGIAIQQQFMRWSLTPTEAEVALLLLKGLSHKAIANVRGTSERTVRDQARSVYAKSELGGRAELSAFFLEDLLLPRSD